MKNRIFGLDTGKYDSQKIEAMDDWELFLEYYDITYLAWRMEHNALRDYSRGYVSDEEFVSVIEAIAELQYSIEYLAYAISKRNNIEVNEPAIDKHISPNREIFMKWYNFYNDHFIYKMPQSTWNDFVQKRKDGMDVSEYLPVGNWREYEPASSF